MHLIAKCKNSTYSDSNISCSYNNIVLTTWHFNVLEFVTQSLNVMFVEGS